MVILMAKVVTSWRKKNGGLGDKVMTPWKKTDCLGDKVMTSWRENGGLGEKVMTLMALVIKS